MSDLPHIRTLDPEVLTKKHVGKAAVTSVLKTIQPVCDEGGHVLTTGGAIYKAIRAGGGIEKWLDNRMFGEQAAQQWKAIWYCVYLGRVRKRRATVSFVDLDVNLKTSSCCV